MIAAYALRTAAPFATLPQPLHYRGEPNEWVRITRPGQRLHSFLEGPWFDADGNLWLADVPYGRVFRVSPNGEWDIAVEYDGEPHGLTGHPDGVVIADYRHGLMLLDAAGGVPRPLCAPVNADTRYAAADCTTARDGSIWFTDPARTSLSDPTGRLFRLRPDAAAPDLVLANIPYPNGVALSPDGKQVYVAATRANAVWRLLADAPDPVWPMVGTHIQLSGGLGPDGLAMHPAGLLAVAHAQAGRAWLFSALGDPVARIDTPGGLWTTAVRFSPDGNMLYIVEAQAGAVHRIDITEFL